MNRPEFRKVFPQALAWGAVLVLGIAVALGQDAQPAAGQRSDGQIEMDVVHALDGAQQLKQDLITAATIQGEVTLSGTVASQANKDIAESVAKQVPGVTGVENNLKIGNPADAQEQQPAADASADQGADGQAPDEGPAPPPQAYPQQGQYPPQGQDPQQYPQGQYPQQQGQYPAYPPPAPPQYGQRPQYAPQQAPAPQYETARGPVTVGQGTLIQLRTMQPVATKHAKEGTPIDFTVIQDVAIGGVLAIPRGATVHGVVVESKKAGELGGRAELALRLTSLDLGGRNYPLDSDEFRVKGPNKTGETVGNAISGGLLGTIIGCAVGRGAGCAIGAGAGVAAGTAASAASSGPGVWIPAEARVDFHLTAPVTVNPVSPQEAARLAQGLFPGGPTLYRRGYYPYGQPYAYAGYPYGYYPPVYYRPYIFSGGYYYWR